MTKKTDLSKCTPAVVVYWTESEAGYGQRPDGLTIFRNREDADKGIAEHWEFEKSLNTGGGVPSCYVRPGAPSLCAVPNDIYKDIKKTGYRFHRTPDWLVTMVSPI